MELIYLTSILEKVERVTLESFMVDTQFAFSRSGKCIIYILTLFHFM